MDGQPVPCGTMISPACGAVPVVSVMTQGFAFVALTMDHWLALMSSLIMMTEPWDDRRDMRVSFHFGMALTAASISLSMVSRNDWMACGAFAPNTGRSHGRAVMPPRLAVASQVPTDLS